MSEVPVAPSILELYVVMLSPEEYPDATITATIATGGDYENTICLCRGCLDRQRVMLMQYAGDRRNFGDLRAYLLHLSEGTGVGIVRQLHPQGEAKCSGCTVQKQGRLPR